MARGERNAGWSGFFLTFTVFAAILLLLAERARGRRSPPGRGRCSSSTRDSPAGRCRPCSWPGGWLPWRRESHPSPGALAGLVLPAFCLLLFWGAAYALAAHLLAAGR